MNRKYRRPILKQNKHIWMETETHEQLRQLKKVYKKSMMQIIKDLVAKEFTANFNND